MEQNNIVQQFEHYFACRLVPVIQGKALCTFTFLPVNDFPHNCKVVCHLQPQKGTLESDINMTIDAVYTYCIATKIAQFDKILGLLFLHHFFLLLINTKLLLLYKGEIYLECF